MAGRSRKQQAMNGEQKLEVTTSSLPERVVDFSAMDPLLKTLSLVDVQVARFSAASARPAGELRPEQLSQRIRYRAQRLPSPRDEEVQLGKVDFEYEVLLQERKLVEISGMLVLFYACGTPVEKQPSDVMEPTTPRTSESNAALWDICLEVNATFNAWPYIRELVSSSLARLRYPALTLPTFRPPQKLPPKGEFEVLHTEIEHHNSQS